MMRIVEGGLDDARVVALVRTHLERARAQTPPESVHALDLSGLRAPGSRLWSAWEGEAALGVGALRRLPAEHGAAHAEIKSMFTADAARGRGVAGAVLRTILDAARADGLARLSLETGATPYFTAAHALYGRHGFVACAPFGDYGPDPNSVFMTLAL